MKFNPLKTTLIVVAMVGMVSLLGCKSNERKAFELIDSATSYQLKAANQYVLGTGAEMGLALRHEDTAKIYEAKSKNLIDSAKRYLTPEQIKQLTQF